MAIKSREDILAAIKSRLGDDTSDDAISLIEDVSDTLNDLTTRLSSSDNEDWHAKYDSLDAEWRKRYRDRFFEGSDEPTPEIPDPPKPDHSASLTFNDLFKEKE